MFEQLNPQFAQFTRQYADAAIKASGLMMENFERAISLQLKTLEDRVTATAQFMSEAADVRDLNDMKSIWPKSFNLVKESAEQMYGVNQEVFGQTLKAGEAIAQIVKSQFDAVNAAAHEGVARTAGAKTSKAAK